MRGEAGRKTEQEFWDAAWSTPVRLRLPSKLNVGVLNLTRLLSRYVQPGMKYLELGCAPGKLLAWVASELHAQASGLDYSQTGIENCRTLFSALQLDIELYQQDLFNHDLVPASYDVVASFGLIEHFDDPALLVRRHIDLVKPGGVALITVPNYRGLYGRLQEWCDKPNLALHNLEIMELGALARLVDPGELASVRTYYAGSFSPWIICFETRLPRSLARLLALGSNAVGLLQPFTIRALAPMLVLEVKKRNFDEEPAPAAR